MQFDVSFVCRSTANASMIIDIETALFLADLTALTDPARLRAFVNALAEECVRYSRFVVVVETHSTTTSEITTTLQCLLAGIMFFPTETVVLYTYPLPLSCSIAPTPLTPPSKSETALTSSMPDRLRGECVIVLLSRIGALLPERLSHRSGNEGTDVVRRLPLHQCVRGLLAGFCRRFCKGG